MKNFKRLIPAVAWLALQCAAGAATINFDALDATGGGVSGATLASYLAQWGVTISGVTPGSQVLVLDDRNVYGGGIVVSPSGHNTLTESQNGPIHFTLNFSVPQSSVSFTRAGLGATLSSFTAWSAHAFNAASNEVSTAGESAIIAANLAPKTFTLTGPGITSVRWDANYVSQGFSSIVMDDLVLPEALASEPLNLFNSGTDSNHVVLPFGSVDPHITIINRTDGLTNTSAYAVAHYPGWLPNDSTSEWLSANPDSLQAGNAQWTYRVPIDLTGYAPGTTRIQARVSCDNVILWTRLNDHDIGYTLVDVGFWSPFLSFSNLFISSGFVSGINYLDFRVNDSGPPSGFRIEISGSAVPSATLTIEVSEVRVCWNSLATKTYQLQQRSSLTTNMWANLGSPVPGNGTRICITEAVTNPQRFYRVVILP